MAVISMKRNRKGQFVAAGRSRSNAPKKRRSHKRTTRRKNYIGAGALVPLANPRRRGRRHNPPAIAGIPMAMPVPGTIAAVLGGLIGPTTIQTLGASIASSGGTQQISPTTKTIIKVVSYVAPPAIGYMIGGAAVMRNVVAGEIAGALAGQVATMIQSALATSGLSGYFPRRPQQRMLSGYVGQTSRNQLNGGNWANRTAVPVAGNMNASRYRSRFHN
jgi:hypothetical protein